MSLAPGEERALRQIGDELCRSDPKLAALLATFTRLTCRDEMPRREFLLGRWSRLTRLFPEAPSRLTAIISVAAATCALGLIVLFVALFAHPRGSDGRGLSCGTPSSASCTLRGDVTGHAGTSGGVSQNSPGTAVIRTGLGAR